MGAAVVRVALDQGMGYPRHFGGDGSVALRFRSTSGGPPDVAFELPTEAVLSLANGRGGGQPVGIAQAGAAPPATVMDIAGVKIVERDFKAFSKSKDAGN